ncbi:Positive regulator of purine utilization [Erysiphe neolycopersici]|uniref:Positive regulator of purine utilization n=1 Tax=Erysiphe neolycopersici TaxID=212602 RepID=A0A420HHQ9_9PEZI|nr:Positive regulator of purine utilization [Erysiphe neolycopersici]
MNRLSSNHNAVETPLLRISRPIAACSRCRRAKIKCDGKLPACSACEKAGYAKSCASPIDKSVDGNEKSYVACLESRIRELEEKISLSISPATFPKIRDSTSPVSILNQKDSLFSQCISVHGKAARRREVADVNKLVSDFGFLSINATTRDFEEATTSMTFARFILAAASNEPLPDYGPFRLPSKSISRALADYYIENILILFPIFDPKVLLDVLEAIYQKNLQHVAESGYWMFYMTLAISSICQSRNKNDRFYRDAIICIRKALSFADRVLVPGCVSQIQALLLIVQYSMLDPVHFDSWNLAGFACRAVIDLGFHQDLPKEEQIDQKTLELRRTLFYCVYSLDRSISMVHARSFSFTDDSTCVAFPSIQSEELAIDTQKNSRMEQCLLIFKLRKIQSSWYQELFQSKNSLSTNPSTYIQNMCLDMQKLALSISKESPRCVKDYFDLELLYSFVYCLAPSSQIKAVPAWGKNLIFESSVKYVQKMITIYETPLNCTFITYHDALRVYFVGSQFVSVLQEDQDFLLYFTTPSDLNLNDFKVLLDPPHVAERNNSERALCCIVQIKELLRTFSHRWDDSKVLLSSFEAQIDRFTEILDQRKKSY